MLAKGTCFGLLICTFCAGLLFCGTVPVVAQMSEEELNARLAEIATITQSGNVQEGLRQYRQLARKGFDARDREVYTEAVNSIVGVHLMQNTPDSALVTYENAMLEAEKWGDRDLILHFALYTAMTKKKFGQSEVAFGELKSLIPQLQYHPRKLSLALQEYGGLYYFLYHQRDSGIWYVDSAIHILEGIQDSVRLSSALETRAGIAHYTGSFLEAIEYSIRALSYVSAKNPLKRFSLLKYITEIFQESGQPERAIEYATTALNFAKEKNYTRAQAVGQLLLGELYFETGEIQKADSLFDDAHGYFSKSPAQREFIQVRTNMAAVDLSRGLPEAALNYFIDIDHGVVGLTPNYVIARYHLVYGRALFQLGNYSDARDRFYTSLSAGQAINDPRSILPALLEIKRVEERLGNSSAALEAADSYIGIFDSTFQLRQSQLLFESESRYRRAEQEKAIAQLNAENAIKDVRITMRDKQLKYGILALIIFAALTGISFYLYRQVRKAKHLVDDKNRQLSKALGEKELLLKEIHHRVKNNLQVVSSLLSLQSRYIEDHQALEAIKQGRDRVKSMALIHQNLYQGEHLTGIAVKPYFEKVVRGLFNSYNISPERITMQLDIDEVILDVDSIVPIGLIVNELVSNALKYAFPDGREGTITVRLKESQDMLRLVVSDNGIGMQGAWQDENATSFGYRLIHAFREKLNADLSLRNHAGTTVEMAIRDFRKAG